MKPTSTCISYTSFFRTYLSHLSRLIEKERHSKPTILIDMILDSEVQDLSYFHFSEELWNESITSFQLNILMVILIFQKQSWWYFVLTVPHPVINLPLFQQKDKHQWSMLHYASLISAYTKNTSWLELLIQTHPSLLSSEVIQFNEFLSFLLALDSPFVLSIFSSTPTLSSSTTSSSLFSLSSTLLSPSTSFFLDCMEKIQSITMLQYLSITFPSFMQLCQSYPLSYMCFFNKPNALELLQWWQLHVPSSFIYHSSIYDLFSYYTDSILLPSTHTFSLLKFLTPRFVFSSSLLKIELSTQDVVKQLNPFSLLFKSILELLITGSTSPSTSTSSPLKTINLTDESESISATQLFQNGTRLLLTLLPLSKTSTSSSSIFHCPFPFCPFETSSPQTLSQHFEGHPLEDLQLDFSYRSIISSQIITPATPTTTTMNTPTTPPPLSSSSSPSSSYLFLICQLCGSTCSDVNSLYHHVALHNTEKWDIIKPLLLILFPYSCEICNNLFTTTRELLFHTRKVHSNSKK